MGIKMKQYLTGHICKTTGVKRNRLQAWIESGFISPSIKKASGHGTRNIWSEEDIEKIRRFKALVELGYHRKLAAKLI